jgi:hypothetical protein
MASSRAIWKPLASPESETESLGGLSYTPTVRVDGYEDESAPKAETSNPEARPRIRKNFFNNTSSLFVFIL